MPFSSNSTRFATTKIFHGTDSIKGKDLSSQQIGFPQNLPYHVIDKTGLYSNFFLPQFALLP